METKSTTRQGQQVALIIERAYRGEDPNEVRVTQQVMQATIVGGVVRWDSNGQVPPRDVLAVMLDTGGITADEHSASVEALDTETAAFIAACRKAASRPDAEELHEMRAAFGEGAEVVNVVTGRATRL
jgi:hypothetical protein